MKRLFSNPWVLVAAVLLQIGVSTCKPRERSGVPSPRNAPVQVPLPPAPFRPGVIHPGLLPIMPYSEELGAVEDTVASLGREKASSRLQMLRESLMTDLGTKGKEDAQKGSVPKSRTSMKSHSTIPAYCQDEDGGSLHLPGDIWFPNNDPCYVCQCVQGDSLCFAIDCKPHIDPEGQTCRPVTNPGQCCPEDWICWDTTTKTPQHN